MKKVIALFLTAVMAISLAGCSSGTPSSSGTSPKQTGLNLKLWIFLNPENTSDPRNVVLKEIVEDYNKTNKLNNKVAVESINYAKFETQCIQAAAAGTGPDIINIYTDMLKKHIDGGTVQPMTKLAENFIQTMPDYIYKTDNLKLNGEIYTMPWEMRTFVYWYRSDIYKSVPTSWDNLMTMAGEKTTKTVSGFTFGLSEGGNGAGFMESFAPLIKSAGGELFDASGKAVFNSDAGVQVLNMMKKMADKKILTNSSISMTVDDVQTGLQAGTVLSCQLGTQRAAAIKKSANGAKVTTAPLPSIKDGETAPAIVAGQSLGIGKFAQSPEASFDFIKQFYTPENQKKWLNANVLTVRKSLYDDAEVKKMSNYDMLKTWGDYASKGSVNFYPADYSEVSVKLAQVAQNVIFKNADPKTQLDQIASWYNTKNKK